MKWVLAALIAFGAAASGADLTITVAGIDKKGGTLRLALFDRAHWKDNDGEPVASADVPATMPETKITLKDIKPGEYGVKTYLDANNNDKFDQNLIGLPLERYGFSRDARPLLSEPGFDRTKFTLKDGANAIVIHLQ